MLSYQHAYHAGNLADVHKHALLAWLLATLAAKDKPLSYIETHAGRGLYDLAGAQARKTGEAAAGIGRLADRIAPDHPYRRVLDAVRARHGPDAYPGSPMLAANLLRPDDRVTLAELHSAEHDALARAMAGTGARVQRRDGIALAQAVCPPRPRRGVLVVDPSYEVATDYTTLPRAMAAIARKWNVGVLVLWYPVLAGRAHRAMLDALRAAMPGLAVFQADFAPGARGLQGSGLAVVNPPWGMDAEAARIAALVAAR